MKLSGTRTTRIRNKIIVLFVLLIIVLAGCNNVKTGNGENVIKENTENTEFEDKQNDNANQDVVVVENKVLTENPELAKKDSPQRVIALSKSNAELWVLAGGKLVGTSDDALEIEGINSDAKSLGDMDHVSLEAVIALEPDLLILFSSTPAQKALGEAAEAVGINVYYTNIDGYSDYDKVMQEFTGMTGDTAAYTKYVSAVRKQIEGTLKKVPETENKKTYLLLHVSATKSKAEKNDYFASEIFNNLGLTNIASDNSAFDDLSLEAIISADPDYIFVVPRGDENKALSGFKELFESQPAWESLSAVSENRYYLLSKTLFGTKPNALWGEAYSTAYELLYGTK